MNKINRETSKKVALCGVLCSFSLVILLLGNVIPLATYCAPALAAVLLLVPQEEYGGRTALLAYTSVAFLSLLLVSDKELALMYVLVLGPFPPVKACIERHLTGAFRVVTKFVWFNGTTLCVYALLLIIFPVPAIADDFAELGRGMLVLLLIIGNITFFIYDLTLTNLTKIYRRKFHSLLFSNRR